MFGHILDHLYPIGHEFHAACVNNWVSTSQKTFRVSIKIMDLPVIVVEVSSLYLLFGIVRKTQLYLCKIQSSVILSEEIRINSHFYLKLGSCICERSICHC